MSILLKKWLLPLLALVGTSMLGGVFISLMTAGKFDYISSTAGANLGIFLSFQMLGVTVAKAGVDSFVLSKASLDRAGGIYKLNDVFVTKLIYLWLAFCLVAFFILKNKFELLACAVTILFDVYSAIRIAEFSAREKYNVVTFGNISKYPLFFFLAFATSSFKEVGFNDLLLIFVLVSFIRWFMLYKISSSCDYTSLPIISIGLLSIQQVLNYLLFRMDQVSIPILANFIKIDSGDLNKFVFFTKYPELVSYFATASGALLFPRFQTRWLNQPTNAKIEIWAIRFFLLCLCAIGLIVYNMLFINESVDAYIFFALVCAAALNFEVNYCTFALVGRDCLKPLVLVLLCAVFAGAVFISLIGYANSLSLIYWGVPLQMFIFIIFANRYVAK